MNLTTTTPRRRWLPRLGALAGAAATAVTLAAGAAGPASAASAPHPQVRKVTAVMTLDCAHMSARAHRYALAHRLCAAGGAGLRPNARGTVSGNCGTSYIEIDNLGGPGDARFTWGFASSQGAAVYRNLEVNWGNERFPRSNGFWSDASVMAGVNYNSSARVVATSTGPVFGDVTGGIVLWWGGTCTLNIPSTVQNIT